MTNEDVRGSLKPSVGHFWGSNATTFIAFGHGGTMRRDTLGPMLSRSILCTIAFSTQLLGCESSESSSVAGAGGAMSTVGAPTSDSPSETDAAVAAILDGDETPGPWRAVGYLPTYRSLDPTRIDFDALTHLCIAFANPTGTESQSDFDEGAREQIAPLVVAAHEAGVKVLASIAGGTKESGELVAAQTAPENVDAYVAGLIDLVERYDLDGIDNDIEGDAVNEAYEPFVQKLREALPSEKLLTAAVATKNGDPVSDGALVEYDFINIMAYDHCSWTDEACDQASIEGVQEDLTYWTKTRGLPRARAVLGVPFYGWCWGCTDKQSALTYDQIISQYPEAAESDWIVDGEKTISLNGPLTIREKTQLAQSYGGVMIWELGQDARGDASLLTVVKEASP